MPYPIDIPSNKHDLIVPPICLSSNSSLMKEIGLGNTASFLRSLEGRIVPASDGKLLSSFYTYPSDNPNPPVSRVSCVIGVAETSLSVVRKLGIDDEEYLAECMHKCTIAVKRADGSFAKHLTPTELQLSTAFVKFMKVLYKQQLVAILQPDKCNRFAMLQPMTDFVNSDDADLFQCGQNYAAYCYIGRIDNVKQYIRKALSTSSSIESVSDQPRKKVKKEHTVDGNVTTGLWQPPGSSDNNNDGESDLWEPPKISGEEETGVNSQNFDTNAALSIAQWLPPSVGNGNVATIDFCSVQHQQGQTEKLEPLHVEINSKFHADTGAAAADRFYSSLTRTLDTRADSRLYHMRAFNGWVKGTQIQELDPKTSSRKLRVLDLACGKGGDLGKWTLHPRGLLNYVGIDVARGSLVDAAIRARKMKQKFHHQRCTFTCADLGADVPGRYKSIKHKKMQKLLTWSLHSETSQRSDPVFEIVRGGGIFLDDKFDVVSVQFAIHYMMQTRQRARRFFQTVSQLLEVGGNLIATTIDARVVIEHLMGLGVNLISNDEDHSGFAETGNSIPLVTVGDGACRIQFEPDVIRKIFRSTVTDLSSGKIDEDLFGLEYTFTLVEGSNHASGVGDAVNLPEWLIPIPVLEALAKEVGLELESAENFHEFFAHRSDPDIHSSLHSTMYNMKVLNANGSISKPEWEISRLYVAVKFRKVFEPSHYPFDNNDGNDDTDDEEEISSVPEKHYQDCKNDVVDIDPKIKAKYLPMALMKAKNVAGVNVWMTLPSEEKNRLIDAELRKLPIPDPK